MSIAALLRARRAGNEPHVSWTPITTADVLRVFGGGRILSAHKNNRRTVTLTVNYPDNYPLTPIQLTRAVSIIDIEKFVTTTVGELERHVVALNSTGRPGWLGKAYLIDEWIDRLALCGVKAVIQGASDDTELPLKPLKLVSGVGVKSSQQPSVADPENPAFERVKRGLTDAEITKFFEEIGISRDDRALTESFSRQASTEDRQPTTAASKHLTTDPQDWAPTAHQISAIRSQQGKRGGVFCRRCYRPMQFSAINGGYDWYCSVCGVASRYRCPQQSIDNNTIKPSGKCFSANDEKSKQTALTNKKGGTRQRAPERK